MLIPNGKRITHPYITVLASGGATLKYPGGGGGVIELQNKNL
jgi:hypothetical protein